MNAAFTAETMLPERGPWPVAAGQVCAQIRAVHLAFGGQNILNGVNFDLRLGELVLLRGENGAGKTVLMNVLSGYLRPDRGSVTLNFGGKPIRVLRSSPESLARRGVGRLWQDIRLFPTMTVLDNVLAATQGLRGENPLLAVLTYPAARRQELLARDRALRNLATVGMADRAQSSCDMLSVGQMKRVALARLLQMETQLFLLDEPFAGLDAAGASLLALDLDRLRKEHGKAILMVEHRHELIAGIADRVWTLDNGRVVNGEVCDV